MNGHQINCTPKERYIKIYWKMEMNIDWLITNERVKEILKKKMKECTTERKSEWGNERMSDWLDFGTRMMPIIHTKLSRKHSRLSQRWWIFTYYRLCYLANIIRRNNRIVHSQTDVITLITRQINLFWWKSGAEIPSDQHASLWIIRVPKVSTWWPAQIICTVEPCKTSPGNQIN